MNHPEDRLASFVDGELGHEARERVLAHLAQCEQCRAEAEEQRRVKALLKDAADPAPSSDLMARLLAVGEQEAGGPGSGQDEPADGAWSMPPIAAFVPTRGPGTARPRGRTAPRAGRPGSRNERSRPVPRRRLTLAAAGAFSMMAVALSSAFVSGGSGGAAGRPAGAVVERNLVDQAATVLAPTGRVISRDLDAVPAQAVSGGRGPALTPTSPR